jgi:dipeptidyl aminopeptidase/acylaminoacyl peptidase
MSFRIGGVLLVAVFVTLGCGATDETSDSNSVDQVAFVAPGSDAVFRMNIDGTSVEEMSRPVANPKVWPDQLRILNSICVGASDRMDDPIEVVSPGGASLGPLDDRWSPEWSPDGTRIAVACGRDDDGTVVVVSDVEQSGNRTGWSRTSRGELSDRIDIYLVTADGSSLTVLTSNQAGDWLPRWHPDGKYLLIESNRDGNSEIYQLAVDSTLFWRITEQEFDDQAPVWSRHGTGLAFASNANGEFEVHLAEPGIGESFATGQKGRPVPWLN